MRWARGFLRGGVVVEGASPGGDAHAPPRRHLRFLRRFRARAARGHRGIENRLHWVLDMVFRDDRARLRTGHGPANKAMVKHLAMNLLRQARPGRPPA